jgi:demethoxyubiquinone hydroxylase (CLK1/Coq7/Cat5 family)
MSQHASLLREMKRALLAEFGARAIYRRLSRLVRDQQLAQLLARFEQEEEDVIASLRATMQALGARPRTGSRRRWLLANALAYSTPVLGPRLALRICVDAEETRARWYAHFSEYLLQRGERDLSEKCGRLSTTKLRHGQALQAWVEHAARHG